MIADGKVDQAEAEYLQKWLVAHLEVVKNPVSANLLMRINDILKDGTLGPDEAQDLFETLAKFSGGDFELGELLKSCSLPLDEPAPDIEFADREFCFTGTFAFGTRKVCESEVTTRGAKAGSLTTKTDYLVVGVYATDSWAHSSYGRKIERAERLRNDGVPIAIVGEQHWLRYLRPS
jgi:NAD-dependent DNA ligase